MPFKRSIVLFFIVLTSAALGLGLSARLQHKTALFAPGDPYARLWKRADSCENKGLTESARKIVEEIYRRAKSENNAPQFVKAVIYKAKLTQDKEDFSPEKNIDALEKEAASANYPAKPVLQSILAEAYWNYFESNRWKFYDRTQTTAFAQNDVSTYDLKAILNAVISNFRSSLRDTALLKTTKVNVFDEVIVKGTAQTRKWRATLYDFLAHRALDFYKNSEAGLSSAANQFNVNDADYLKPYPTFLKLDIVTPEDSLDLTYRAVTLFKDLLNFQLRSGNEEGLVDVELERLDFINANSTNEFKDSLYLQALDQLAKQFAASPRLAEIKFMQAGWWLAKAPGRNYPLANDKTKWYRKKAFDICNGIITHHPGSRGAQMAKNTLLGIQAQELNVTAEATNDADLPNRVLLNYTNIQNMYFRLVQLSFFEYEKLIRLEQDKAIAKLLSLPAVQSFGQVLPVDPDFNPHAVEIKVPAVEVGYYALLAASSAKFSGKEGIVSYQPYVVTNMAYLDKRKTPGGYEFYILNRQSGKPLSNVTAQVWYSGYNYKLRDYENIKGNTYTSDESGHIEHDGEGNTNSFSIEFINGKDRLMSSRDFYNYRDYDNNNAVTRSFIFTDRAIYRPGQTIYFKSIILKGIKNKNSIQPNQAVTVYFYDVNHQKIASQDLITNEYGTVSGSFTTPQGVLTGQMEITDGNGSVQISVEEYKRPKFETLFDTLRGSYRLNDELSVKGFAKAFAGNNVDGAMVKYRVIRRVNYPSWYYWYKAYNPRSTEVEIANGLTQTNSEGTFYVTFKALPDLTASKNDNPTYTYEISADVTDVNGETRIAQTSFRVGYKAIELSFSSPEIVNVQSLPKMSVNAVNLNGVEESVSGTITIYSLKQTDRVFRERLWARPDKHLYSKEEYYRLFPQDLYDDENNKYKWEKIKKQFVLNFNTKTDKDIVFSEFKSLAPGVYLAEGLCKDPSGEEVRSVNYITVYDPASAELPLKTAQWNYDIKVQAEPGDKASVIFASSYKEINCIYDLEGEQRHERKFISPSLSPITISINEADRGGLSLLTNFIKYGRAYAASHYISVPFTNKALDIEYATFRNKLLPGQQEEWKLTVKNKKGDKVAAEMLAAMYDASLDAFKPNNWNFDIYESFYPHDNWQPSLGDISTGIQYSGRIAPYIKVDALDYDQLNYFGMDFSGTGAVQMASYSADGPEVTKNIKKSRHMGKVMETVNFAPPVIKDDAVEGENEPAAKAGSPVPRAGLQQSEQPVTPRKNFNETAFFFPQLQTNEKGEVIIKFTMPESLTKWKLMGLAHTKDLSYGQTQNEVVTQKELMVVPNAPRFFREGDQLTFVSKISNLSQNDLSGTAEIKFYDAFTEQEISGQLTDVKTALKNFTIKKGLSTSVEWNVYIPEGLQAVKYRVIAKAGNFSDGEEMAVPVLTNKMLVTESLPLAIRGNSSKEFVFDRFMSQNNHSATLKNHAYTLEFTSNPAWYAVQSLPYLMEYPYECAEQTFARYYANALASHVVSAKPKIKEVFAAWNNKGSDAFLSSLEKNQELKSLLLEETPWVMDAKNESENKKRVALLFDLNKMGNELNAALHKLQGMQGGNGGWPWFKGGPEDLYITQHILTGLKKLEKLGADTGRDERMAETIASALRFCDLSFQKNFDNLKLHFKNYENENHLEPSAIQYLYMRSFFEDKGPSEKEAIDFYKKQAQKYWSGSSRYLQAMIAISLNRAGDKKTAGDIMRSLKENALSSEEMGMYWKENYSGYYWYEAPIEKQAMMIEAFDEVSNDTKAVDDLKTWLIKSKQTQNWGTTRATTEAVYALLLKGTDWLTTEPAIEINLGNIKVDPKNDPEIKTEAGTGYFKKTYSGSDIQPAMGKIKVNKKSAGVSWGAVYWQYFEQLDKITPHETPLKLSKKLFIQSAASSGPVITPITETTALKVGDKIKVRIELKVDRDLEYVHLKDMRAAGLEPVNVLSGYRYQDGLGYYESTGDASSSFFIPYLPKGSYVFEYAVLVSHAGDFSNGISNIQCMYAPEFTSHSEGIRLRTTK